MLNLFILFSLYFTSPINNADFFDKVTCENQKEYIISGDTSDKNYNIMEDGVSIYSGAIGDNSYRTQGIYCLNNKLHVVYSGFDESFLVSKIFISRFDGDTFTVLKTIEDVEAYSSIISNNKLIYYRSDDHYFHKLNLDETLENDEQYIQVSNYNLERFFYFENLDGIIYINTQSSTIRLQKADGMSETYIEGVRSLYNAIYLNGKFYFIFNSNATPKKIEIINSDKDLFASYDLVENDYIKKSFLFANEYGLYAFTLVGSGASPRLELVYIPEYIESKQAIKVVSENVNGISSKDDFYFFKKNGDTTDINVIKGTPTKPEPPVVESDFVGILSEIPSSFSISNFSQDPVFFLSYDFDISPNETFNSVYYGENRTVYNPNASSQIYPFYSNFVFQENKPYYMRIRYNGIFASSEYSYIRFIITDLGEISFFNISDMESNSNIFTNNELVKINLEKLGTVDLIQISNNENFKNNNGNDIVPIDFESEFNFIIPSEEKEYLYYVRPVVFDAENLMGWHQAKTAKITLDKTKPSKPSITTENNKEFFKDNIEIKWDESSDNLSGVESYKIRLVDSFNEEEENIVFDSTKLFYIPTNKDLLDGVYTVFLSSCDYAKNCSDESKLNFTVIQKENYKPYKPTLIRPKNKDIIDSMPFNISWSKSDDPEDDKVTYTLVIAKDINFNEKEYEAYLIENLSQNITYLSQGHYFLKLFATDEYANESDYEIIEFDIIEPKKSSKNSSGCSFN
jgi:hypothetical protein